MCSRKPLFALFAAVLIARALPGVVSAQEFRGSITGTVIDGSGGVLPGVTVVVKNSDTGVVQDVVTDDKGLYQVLYLNPGRYEVSAELQGFKKFMRTDNQVGVGDVLRIDVTLETGGIEEVVSVVSCGTRM